MNKGKKKVKGYRFELDGDMVGFIGVYGEKRKEAVCVMKELGEKE
ncbi:hypothetical protein [Bacillus sp. WP8]|nr:hypothetical protein [Bacillus sp. WP8]